MSGESFLVQLWHFSRVDTPFAVGETYHFSRTLFTEYVQERIVTVIGLLNRYMHF